MKRNFGYIHENRQRRVSRKKQFGVYKPEFHGELREELRGDGLVSYITDKFSQFNIAFKGRPKVINELMEKTKGIPVVGISVIRQPIVQIFETLLNKLTFGKLRSKMKELGYDKLFHLYVKFDLKDGSFYMIEKNQRVMIRTSVPDKNAEFSEVTRMTDGRDIKSYIEMLESKNIPNIYIYNAFKENCQHFVRNLMNANGITKYDSFISQNTEVLAGSTIQKIAKGVTGLAGKIDVLMKGGSDDTGLLGSGIMDFFTPEVDLEDNINNFVDISDEMLNGMWYDQ